MAWSFPIGRLFGSELRVHATFFLLLLWIGGSAFLYGGWLAAWVNVAFVLSVFACVVAHEYGHALMARRFGIATPDITLLPIGGLARLERMPERPRDEIAVALAGPAVNVVIFLVLLVIIGADADIERLTRLDDPRAGFLDRLAVVNLFLVVFNMIPAFPMDGGRVLRALLALRLSRARATRLAAWAGQGIAFLFGLTGLLLGNPLLILIAVFVFFAAGAESADAGMREVAHSLKARDAMITSFESLEPDSTLEDAAAALIRTTQHEFPVLDPYGKLAGFLTRSALVRAMAEGVRVRPVREVMDDVPQVVLTAPLADVLDALQGGAAPAVGVTDRWGHFVGYVTTENLGELMILRSRREG